MRVVIADDEMPARNRLRAMIEELELSCTVVAEAATGVEALTAASQFEPDVVILDIRMPDMDGLEAARHLAKLDPAPAIIFVTAYDAHAVAAFELAALDYVLKPVRSERLLEALSRCDDRSRAMPELAAPGARRHLSAMVAGSLRLIPVTQVRYLLAEQKYVLAGWPEGELPLAESLKSLEQEFAASFIRVHRNALVATRYVAGMNRTADGHYEVLLEGVDLRVPVSRRQLSAVRQRLREL